MMILPTSPDESSRSLAAIEDELARLDRREAQLQAALDDVEHDMRRCNDEMERAGWRSAEAEARGSMLAESRRAIVDDRESTRVRRAELTECLVSIAQGLDEAVKDD